MIEWIQANPALVGGIVLLLAAALWLLLARRKPRAVQREYRDVLSEGAAPAQRNSALIDAPPAAAATSVAAVVDTFAEAIAPTPAAVVEGGDDLTRIKGLGPKLRSRLAELGITTFAQIAGWSDADLAAIDAQLGSFAGRPARDNWIEQAGLLIAGDTAAYEAKFGKL
ncbi:hypothetical protein [Novosphingobium sp. FKTRR1]|uniref:hypothetical protein n=1 Tax=Novosphingobium sp. FKTRR1 TaxID=2879118 RepID=UPI001CF08BD2|nr:hypothetical protein [Novosphingobium sp. FKTRR1]